MKRRREMKRHTVLLVMVAVFVLILIGKNVFQAAWNGIGTTPKDEITEERISDKKEKDRNEKDRNDERDDEEDEDDDENDTLSSAGKRIELINKSRLEDATGEKLTFDNVDRVQKAMSKVAVWEELGFSRNDAQRIAQRVQRSSNQTRGILRGISKKDYLSFKVILLDNGHVNIGKGRSN